MPPPHTEGTVTSSSSSRNNDLKENNNNNNNRNTTTRSIIRNNRKGLVVGPNVLVDKSTLVGPMPKSPLAAIKSRMRRIENIRRKQQERQQQMIELTQYHHENAIHSYSSIVSLTTETASGTADMTQSEPEHEEDANETIFFEVGIRLNSDKRNE